MFAFDITLPFSRFEKDKTAVQRDAQLV